MDKTARLWNISSGSSLKIYKGHKGAILCLAVDHDNKMLFTGKCLLASTLFCEYLLDVRLSV